MMIGKIKRLNFKSLLIIIVLALIFTSHIFNNYTFLGSFLTFFLISKISTKHGLKKIKEFNFFQTIREEGPAFHFSKMNTPTIGGIFIIVPFLVLLLILTISLYSLKILLLFFCILGFFGIGFLDDYLSIKNKRKI